ncbi:MAG: tRNA 4-thiouridine(8) synthase ThiI [Lachnospiraceae bacterium]|nr:tRNA 4-thiouridine(8) synthase ThiI [Lachnospiraceae bacterium]
MNYYKSFLIKYAEIGIKGKNRHLFEEALVRQIKYALRKVAGSFSVSRTSGRIYVEAQTDFDFTDTVDALKAVFGIAGICPMVSMADEGFEKLSEAVVKFVSDVYFSQGGTVASGNSLTFKIAARRSRKNYPLDSMELNAKLGGIILDAFPSMKVDVHKPNIMIHVEIREKINLYSEIIPGPGGMPVGTNGKAMLLLSGGIDSPVAGYMIAKRGVKIDAVYFHAPPYTSDRAKQKVIDLAKTVSRFTGPVHLHIINFTDIQLYIYDQCPHEELTIIMRRYMMRIAEHIANETDCLGLITGESIGQVASQTLKSLAATNEVCTLPVYRPLIGFDKMEIVKLAEQIGTYETSIQPFEDCCTIFVAKHPVTKPNVKRINRSEEHLAERIDELVKRALENKEVVIVKL